MGDGRWEVGSGSVRCGCQMCSAHELKDEHKSKPMFVPFSTCMVVRALSVFFKHGLSMMRREGWIGVEKVRGGDGDGRWEVGSGSVRCGCQMCSTHGIKAKHKSKPMFVPFSTCMVVRALSTFLKQKGPSMMRREGWVGLGEVRDGDLEGDGEWEVGDGEW